MSSATRTVPTEPHVMPTFGRLPIAIARGQGCRVWDTEGRSYLDALAGIAVNTLGHNHAEFVAALQQQMTEVIHCCNYYYTPNAEKLAAKLTDFSGMTNVFYCNSGLEANEAAIKLARKYGHDKGIHNPQIVVYEKAFHGRSIATLSATGNAKIQKGFEPLLEGFIRVPVNNIDELKQATEGNPNVVAVFLETIQGEGGVNPMHMDYLRDVRELCNQRDWLMMVDEVQSGMGRTGKWFAHQWAGVVPDVMPLAKGLASGVPIGAVVAGPKAAGVLTAGTHGSTFGGNPLAVRAGLETIRIMEKDDLMGNAARMGQYLADAFKREFANEAGVKDIRGQGLMIGIELDRACGAIMQRALDAGLMLSVTADTVVRLLPPLIITQAECDELIAILVPLIKTFLAEKA